MDKTHYTVIAAVLAVALAGQLRPPSSMAGVPVDDFWNKKILWRHAFDVAVVGDSRVLLAVSPARLGQEIPGQRIGNYGFSLVGYSPDYLDAVEAILDPASRRPIVVAAIDPHAFTPNAARERDARVPWQSVHPWRVGPTNLRWDNEFQWMKEQHPLERRLNLLLGPLLEYLGPFHKIDLMRHLAGEKVTVVAVLHEDGWIAARQPSEGPHVALKLVGAMYDNNHVSPAVVGRFLERVVRWTASGIAVYGLRVPTDPELARRENLLSLFDERDFRARFEAAGGVWIEFAHGSFETYDGHHLSEAAALELSTATGRVIARHEKERLGGP